MHRQPFCQLLDRYQIIFAEDREILERFHAFTSQYSDCFERSQSFGHITGSAWIIDHSRTHGLFTHHKKLGRWLQLGGHADGDSDVHAVATREAHEESGLKSILPISNTIFDLDVHSVGDHLHFDVRFLFEANMQDPLIVSHESNHLAWIAFKDLPKHTNEPSILRMLSKTTISKNHANKN